MQGSAGQTAQKAMAPTTPTAAAETVRPESLIDKHSSFNGHYRSTHNLRIEGEVDGEIECDSTLTIAEAAKVKAKVVAQNVVVGGTLDGEVTCPGRFQILPSGRVVGKVTAGTLEIQAGAFYQGELSMHSEPSKAPFGNGKSDGGVPRAIASVPSSAAAPAATGYNWPEQARPHGGDGK